MRKLYAECRLLASFAPEQKRVAAEWVGSNHLLRLRRETIEAAAQINRAAGKKHLRAWCQADHVVPFIARSTRDSACSLTKASTQTRAPFGNAISIPPAPPPLI